jgi:para-nitrobenzyl esterase
MTRRNPFNAAALAILLITAVACKDDKDAVTADASSVTADDSGTASGHDAGSGHDGSATHVSIADGQLEGVVDGKTRKFLGIPYAKPPVGGLRWKLPQKNEPWTGVRDASMFGPRCAQLASATLMNAESDDEDCLYLNVWTPQPATKSALPVMVWFHGGGNVNGSASEPVPFLNTGAFYSGQTLAEKGVVVVTLNYRLGAFGFFAHPDLASEDGSNPGNQGLYDQTQALQWVHDNIAKFGGDPKNVTIFGESAGSLDVCFHMASPKSRGLFQRAISESGGCTTRNATLPEGQKVAQDFASALDCGGDKALDCLRGKSVSDILKQPASSNASNGFGPVVDGTFLPDQARALYDQGKIAKVPYLLGSNRDEGTLFIPSTLTLDGEDQLKQQLQTQYGDAVDDILKLYPLSDFADAEKPAMAAYARIVGDSVLVCTTYDSAVRAADAKVPGVWMYNFAIPVMVSATLGATHGSELTYVFGSAPNDTPEQAAAGDIIRNYWVAFAKSGDPNASKQLAWPSFTSKDNVRMNFELSEPSIVHDFRAAECEFWRSQYDKRYTAQ